MLRLFVKAHHLIHTMKDESGQDLVEYALLGALVALACAAALPAFAAAINAQFTALENAL
jgi:pilus assembly protein Flp/PilA